MIDLIVKAKHFEGTDFQSPCNCALAKAAKEQFSTFNVREEGCHIMINKKDYEHEIYIDQFDDDQEKAASLNYSDEVIRTIQLTPIQ